MKILTADNDRKNLDFMTGLLSGENYECLALSSGQDLLDRIGSFLPNIVVMEVNFRGLDGYNLVREIKKAYLHIPCQIIAVSRQNEYYNLVKTVEAGGDDFMSKPLDNLEFIARVKAAEIRFINQFAILHEKDFFRKAVKQEEELSSKILDQNIHLKEAYQKLISVNRELSESNRHLEKIAKYDALSGLLNRMSLYNMLEVEIDRCLRTGLPLSGIMLDIDNFKDINDNYGHHYGDMVIQEFGKRLIKTMRKYDYAGRYGGEEFFLILPNTDKFQAVSIAERFRKQLEELPIEVEDAKIPMTASFGISTYKPGDNRQSWVSRADKAMYTAKQSGKNRVFSD